MKRLLAIWLPNWPVQRLASTRPEQQQRCLVLHHRTRRGQCVAACCAQAYQLGVRVDMPLAEATALARGKPNGQPAEATFQIEPYDAAADQAALLKLAHWCHRFSPRVAIEETDWHAPRPGMPATLLLEIAGVAPLFGGEPSLLEQVSRAFRQRGLTVRVGLADTLGAAWAVAHYSRGAAQSAAMIVRRDETPAALAELPPAALRLPDGDLETLDRLGIDRVGVLLSLPRAELASRFSPLLLRRIDQALGTAAETMHSVSAPLDFEAEWLFEYPTDKPEAVEFAANRLVERLAAQLTQHGQGALSVTCRFECGGAAADFEIGMFRPTAQSEHLHDLLKLQMDRLELPGPVTEISLRVPRSAPLACRQQELFAQEQRRHDAPQVAALVDRLTSRLGRRAVLHCRLRSDPQPELAYREQPLIERRAKRQKAPQPNVPAMLDRPLHLLARPAELQVVAIALDGPPIRFQYRGHSYQVARHWGPERIETGWWRKRKVRRDYYRIETDNGRRFWLFRRLDTQQWFLHGIFD